MGKKHIKKQQDKLKIKILGDTILRKKLRTVDKITPVILKTIEDMWYVLEKAHGAGLAANQIGIDKRIIVVNTGLKNEKIALINPEIIEYSESKTPDQEGCLSIPGFVRYISRPSFIKVQGMNTEGKIIQIEAKSFYAKAFQHEIDHTNGIMMIDYLEKKEIEALLKHYGIEENNIEYKMLEESRLRPVKKVKLYDARGELI